VGIDLKNKGQMFFITSVILVIVLVVLRTTVNLPDIVQQKREMEGRFEQEFFSNIANELVRVIKISYYQENNITRNVFDFANFTKEKMNERTLNFKFLYVSSITLITESRMDVTVINLLGKSINVTLTLNDSQVDNRNDISDFGTWYTNFTITPGNGYVLSISYDSQPQNITIITDDQKSVYVGFFDINLIGSETTFKDKFQKTYILTTPL
jgi:hypothetical protein